MRLFEFEDPQVTTKKRGVLISLLNLIQTKAQKRDSNIKLPFSSLQKLMHNVGYDISYLEFEKIAANDPMIRSSVSDYNDEYIVVGKERDETDLSEPEVGDDQLPDLEPDLGADDQLPGADDQFPTADGTTAVAATGVEPEPTNLNTVRDMARRAVRRRD